jgi:hypothetical protein
MTYSTLKKISVASVAATMFMGTTAVSVELPKKSPFDQSKCIPTLGPGFDLGLGVICPASTDPEPCIILPEFNFIGVDDQGVNDSQFFKMDLTVSDYDPTFLQNFEELYQGYDIEALDSMDPTKNLLNTSSSCLYAASGDDDGGNPECDTGCLYLLNKSNGSLKLEGDICTQDEDLKEIDALAFRPHEWGYWEELWGWSRQDGLFKIETPKAQSNLCGDNRKDVRAEMICDIPVLVVEDMTWVEKEGVFYAYVANEKAIYKFNPDASCENYEKVCTSEYEIEALEYMEYRSPDEDKLVMDLLVLGYDAAENPVAAIDLNNPRDPQEKCNLLDSTFPTGMDVEGLASP